MKRRTFAIGLGTAAVGLACGLFEDTEPADAAEGEPKRGGARKPTGKGFTNLEYDFEDYPRHSVLYVPETAPKRKAPLLFAMHGGTGKPEHMYDRNGFQEVCDEQGWIGLFPYMNLPLDAPDRIGDFNYTDHILRKTVKEFNVDRSRIYVVGFSGGGKKAYMHAARNSKLITAMAVCAARIGFRDWEKTWDPAINKAKPVSVLHIHGDKDHRIPTGGGPDKDRPKYVGVPLREGLEVWARHNACKLVKSAPTPDGCPDRVRVHRWSASSGRQVLGLTDPEMKHQWASWGTDVIVDFLKAAPRRS